MNDYFQVFLTSVFSVLFLFILTKMMGYKQLSQLSIFDYINGITIGSIAAELSTELEDPIKPLIAMAVYAFLALAISLISCKSIKFRRFFTGDSIVLMSGGKIFMKNLLRARIDINDLLTQCRINGYFDIADIQVAIMESNGAISFLPKSTARPITPEDISLSPEQEQPTAVVILDGKVFDNNLKYTGKDIQWLKKELKAQGFSSIDDVMLATCDVNDKLTVYEGTDASPKGDMFC